jgi:hypothetical protein
MRHRRNRSASCCMLSCTASHRRAMKCWCCIGASESHAQTWLTVVLLSAVRGPGPRAAFGTTMSAWCAECRRIINEQCSTPVVISGAPVIQSHQHRGRMHASHSCSMPARLAVLVEAHARRAPAPGKLTSRARTVRKTRAPNRGGQTYALPYMAACMPDAGAAGRMRGLRVLVSHICPACAAQQ